MTKRFVYAVILSVGTAGSVVAQQLGELSGRVHDAEGAPVEGVGVVAEHGTTGERNSAATDEQGRYRIIALPPGIYTVTASGPGFETMVRENVRVVADDVTRLNFDQRSGFIVAAPSLERLSIDINVGYSMIDGIDTDLVKSSTNLAGSVRYNFGFLQAAAGLRLSNRGFRTVEQSATIGRLTYNMVLPFLEVRKHIMIGVPHWYPFVVGRVGYALESMTAAGAKFRASSPAIGASAGMRYQANATIGLELGASYDYLDFGDYEARVASTWGACVITEGGNMTPLIRTADICSQNVATGPVIGNSPYITWEGTARSIREFRIFLGVTIILTKAGG